MQYPEHEYRRNSRARWNTVRHRDGYRGRWKQSRARVAADSSSRGGRGCLTSAPTAVLSHGWCTWLVFLMPRSRRTRARCSTRGAAVPTRSTLLLLSLLSAACTVDSVDPSHAVDTVVVTPSTITMVVGSTVSFQAEARDASGAVLDREAFWAADDPAVATVTDSGDVTARSAGVVQIAASIEGKSGIADITVTGVPVASVQVQPPNATLKVGESVTFTAQPRDSRGTAITGRGVSWSSSNAQVASVNSSGRVTAVSPGGTIISAQSEGQVGLATVTVSVTAVASVRVSPTNLSLNVGQSAPLQAQTLDASNNPLPGRTVLWFTSNSSVATVNTSGVVTAVGSGTATITATSEGKSATAAVVVAPPPSTITVTPSSATVDVGKTVQLNAVYRDGQGRTVSKTFNWESSNTQVATVSSSGKVTGRKEGTVTIKATASGITGTATITVRK